MERERAVRAPATVDKKKVFLSNTLFLIFRHSLSGLASLFCVIHDETFLPKRKLKVI